MRIAIRLVLLIQLVSVITGCDRSSDPSASAEKKAARAIQVVVTSEPLLEMARTVSGDAISIQKIVPDDASSRKWNPGRNEVRDLQRADAILFSGAGYEPWKDRVSLPGSRITDTASGYYEQFVRIPDAVTHQHGPEGEHAHPGTVWATWLDPDLAISQLSQVTSVLVRLVPEHKQPLEAASARLKAQFENLNLPIMELIAATPDKEFTVFADGPSYHYLTKRLGWRLQYLHWDETGSFPTTEQDQFRTVFAAVPTDAVRIFLLSTRQPEEAAEFVTAAGFKVVRIDLCEYPAPDLSLVDRLRGNLERLNAAIKGRKD